MAEVNGRYAAANANKMSDDGIGPRKTLLVLVVVVGCFAVLWPRVLQPMIIGSADQHMKPSAIDKTTGCCGVLSDADVHTIRIMSQLCSKIVGDERLRGPQWVSKCRQQILTTCGIDISAVLQEQVKLGRSFKQILDEVRSLNGSLCLKHNFGVAPWTLGVRHFHSPNISDLSIPQERPPHIRPDIIHPAFRERGSAISQGAPPIPKRGPVPRIVEGKPGPIPGMRPTIGGAGHVVPPRGGGGSMGIIMPMYTIAIVIFFAYTLMKLVFKKQPDHPGAPLYPPVTPDPEFRREVFESSNRPYVQHRAPPKNQNSKIGDAELEQLRRRLRETEQAMERIVEQMNKVPLGPQDGKVSKKDDTAKCETLEDDQTAVKVLGMETTASCEGGEKWTHDDEPKTSIHTHLRTETPQEILLEGALPAHSKLLVTDSAIETRHNETPNDPAVVLAGKMTLSLISDTQNERPEETNEQSETVEEVLEESKYTTADNDVSEDGNNEEDDLEVEIAHFDDDQPELSADEGKPNHVGDSSGPEE